MILQNRRHFGMQMAIACCSELAWPELLFAETNKKTELLAHYMPWFVGKPFSQVWGWHWTMGKCNPDRLVNGHPEVAAHDQPIIGPYDSGDPHVLEYHLLLMKTAGISGVIVDWYGLTEFRDYAILHQNTLKLLEACEKYDLKLAICYEDQTISTLQREGRIGKGERITHALGELQWLSRHFFSSPCYFKNSGQPLLLSFGHDGLTDMEWSEALERFAKPVDYISQNIRRKSAVGGFDWPTPKAGPKSAEQFVKESSNWPQAIPVVYPRFVDFYAEAGVGESFGRVEDRGGRTFDETLRSALASKRPLIQIATWNDWGEGTAIEPGVAWGYRDLEKIRELTWAMQFKDGRKEGEELRLPFRLFMERKKAGSKNSAKHRSLDTISGYISAGQFRQARDGLEMVER